MRGTEKELGDLPQQKGKLQKAHRWDVRFKWCALEILKLNTSPAYDLFFD